MTKQAKENFETAIDLLHHVQMHLHAPKNQYNSFGKYHYRSCEDILEGLKDVLPAGASVTIDDSIEAVGDRVYIKATATLRYKGEQISISAYAREPRERKGMDEAQVTGASSSYARKYALNGLFLIDDVKDADTNESKTAEKSAPKEQPKQKQPEKQKADKPEDDETQRARRIYAAISDAKSIKTLKEITELHADFLASLSKNQPQIYKQIMDLKEKRTNDFEMMGNE